MLKISQPAGDLTVELRPFPGNEYRQIVVIDGKDDFGLYIDRDMIGKCYRFAGPLAAQASELDLIGFSTPEFAIGFLLGAMGVAMTLMK
jgi:hypothetical protein